jgi:homoserine kinase type II
MGIKTDITLKELNNLFPTFNFTALEATTSGIIDTTYFVYTKNSSYILKHYEHISFAKIEADAKLLKYLNSSNLNVPILLAYSNNWYIYKRLQGTQPNIITTRHIVVLARFLAKFHNLTSKKSLNMPFFKKDEINKILNSVCYKTYKKYSYLKDIKFNNDGIIHGDIFKDNTVFYNFKIGVFDFGDSADGSFAFDIAIALFGFNINNKQELFINLFLNTYNQQSKKKITKNQLLYNLKIASDFYTLKRIFRSKKFTL